MIWIAALALATAPPPPQAAPSAREIVERQLAKPPPPQTPRLSAEEAAAIRERYLESIGEPPRTRQDQGRAPSAGGAGAR